MDERTAASSVSSLNRTFMELKHGDGDGILGSLMSLNRTFMELKQDKAFAGYGGDKVLIEPLWN